MCISVETRPRITPACAGRRDRPGLFCSIKKDHPRVCGEKMRNACSLSMRLGSPPRVRGEVTCFRIVKHTHRITPACAGRRNCRRIRAAGYWDHPRVCGEKAMQSFSKADILGSPPRVRGEADHAREISSVRRITPACAGRSVIGRHGIPDVRDHPRVCGEKHGCIRVSGCDSGSPPRVRGEAK